MVLELAFLVLLIVGLCALAYRSAVHEFQILQKDFTEENNWSELLSEELPLVIRGIPNLGRVFGMKKPPQRKRGRLL